jgi:uncharacterized membrane protein YphA (DoxX/SURF4 family)
MVAVLLRLGLGASLLNGGLLGYLASQRGAAPGLAWSTLLGPAFVAAVLQRDVLVPLVQIGLGMALILGFFTRIAAVGAGFLVLAGPIFQFLAILSSSGMNDPNLEMQALVSTGTTNLLLLVTAVLWMTPSEGTPWSLDALIFAQRRHEPAAPPAPTPTSEPGPATGSGPPPRADAAAEPPAAAVNASHGE